MRTTTIRDLRTGCVRIQIVGDDGRVYNFRLLGKEPLCSQVDIPAEYIMFFARHLN